MTSPGVLRERALRALKRARQQHGDAHPATYAAYARAIVAWNGRVREPLDANPPAPLALAYGRALHRASGSAYVDNRSTRKRRA